VQANTLLWNIGKLPCRFAPDRPGACGWWLGYSASPAKGAKA
jgi:hypothetical protein